MSQLEKAKLQVHLGVLVDQRRRDELVRLAHKQDRSISSVVRRAIDAELARERTEKP
jgi:post-segregation antitoxin (ccd killing protein)